MKIEFTLMCTEMSCRKNFTEAINLPMLVESAVARMGGWACPECGDAEAEVLFVTVPAPETQ